MTSFTLKAVDAQLITKAVDQDTHYLQFTKDNGVLVGTLTSKHDLGVAPTDNKNIKKNISTTDPLTLSRKLKRCINLDKKSDIRFTLSEAIDEDGNRIAGQPDQLTFENLNVGVGNFNVPVTTGIDYGSNANRLFKLSPVFEIDTITAVIKGLQDEFTIDANQEKVKIKDFNGVFNFPIQSLFSGKIIASMPLKSMRKVLKAGNVKVSCYGSQGEYELTIFHGDDLEHSFTFNVYSKTSRVESQQDDHTQLTNPVGEDFKPLTEDDSDDLDVVEGVEAVDLVTGELLQVEEVETLENTKLVSSNDEIFDFDYEELQAPDKGKYNLNGKVPLNFDQEVKEVSNNLQCKPDFNDRALASLKKKARRVMKPTQFIIDRDLNNVFKSMTKLTPNFVIKKGDDFLTVKTLNHVMYWYSELPNKLDFDVAFYNFKDVTKLISKETTHKKKVELKEGELITNEKVFELETVDKCCCVYPQKPIDVESHKKEQKYIQFTFDFEDFNKFCKTVKSTTKKVEEGMIKLVNDSNGLRFEFNDFNDNKCLQDLNNKTVKSKFWVDIRQEILKMHNASKTGKVFVTYLYNGALIFDFEINGLQQQIAIAITKSNRSNWDTFLDKENRIHKTIKKANAAFKKVA